MSLYFDHSPDEGWIETFDYNEADDRVVLRRYCDVQPAIDRNKSAHLDGDGWVGAGRDMRLAASIPLDVALLWLQKYGVSCWKAEHWPAVKRLLSDPEWRYLRPHSFRL